MLPLSAHFDRDERHLEIKEPLMLRALEELKMLTQTDIERERYEARRKAQLDYNSSMNASRRQGLQEGRQEGLQEGLSRGEKIGTIHLCEHLLRRPQTSAELLTMLSLEQLTKMADELQAELTRQSA